MTVVSQDLSLNTLPLLGDSRSSTLPKNTYIHNNYLNKLKFIAKCDSLFYFKVRQVFYYKVRQVLQSETIITKCDRTCRKIVKTSAPQIVLIIIFRQSKFST